MKLKKTKLLISRAILFFFVFYCPNSYAAKDEVKDSFNPAALISPDQAPQASLENRITLDLKGVDILDVLKIIGQRSSLNIVAGKNVQGNVTLYLKDVLIRDAMNTILATLDLSYIEKDGIVNVMSNQEFEAGYGLTAQNGFANKVIATRYISPEEATKVVEQLKSPRGKIAIDQRTRALVITDRIANIREIERTIREIDQPLETKVFKVQYAEVETLVSDLQQHLTPAIGILNVDKRTNQISVTDRSDNIKQIESVVGAFDVKPRQVLIEAKLIEVSLYDTHRSGIDWEYIRSNLFGNGGGVELRPVFNLAAPATALGGATLSTFTFGGVAGMQVILSLLQNLGKTDTLSTPRVTVVNNEEAKLVDATKQPYISQTVVQSLNSAQTADNIQFVDVGVTLTVVPTIANDEKLVLRLKPEVSTQTGSLDLQSVAQGSNTAFTRSSIPIVSSQSLETTVLVKSGETLVVGGLIKDKKTKARGKLPFISDIPLIGRLAQSEAVDFQKSELVIFLTPYILQEADGALMQPVLSDEGKPATKVDGVIVGDPGNVLNSIKDPIVNRRDSYWDKSPRQAIEEISSYERYQLVKDYQQILIREIKQRLSKAGALEIAEGKKASLILSLLKDGTLKNVLFRDAGLITVKENREKVLAAVQQGGGFPEFPWELNAQEEAFYVRL